MTWRLSLDQAPTGPGQRRTYLSFAALIALASLAVLPFASTPLPAVPEVNLFYASVVVVTDLATALLLFGQTLASRRPPLLVLSAAYLFTGAIVLPHLVYFSEFSSSLGVLTARPQTAAYLWHFWHIGFPLLVLSYAVAEHAWDPDAALTRRQMRRAVAGTVTAVLVVVALLTVAATLLHDALPVLHNGRTWNPITYQLGWTMALLTIGALALLLILTRGRQVLHLWMIVALTAFFFDFTPNLLAGQRFALGWYVGRMEAMIASSFLLIMLLTETNQLYGQLARALGRLGSLNKTLERRVSERTARLEEANTALRQTVAEREALLAELYHRVNNSLQTVSAVISIEGRGLSDPAAADAFRRVVGRVNTMGLIHQHLLSTGSLTEVDLQVLLSDLCEALTLALSLDDRRIVLGAQGPRLALPLDAAITLALLVNELVAATVQGEGAAGSVHVRADIGDDPSTGHKALTVLISGNGVDAQAVPSASQVVIHALTRQLRGSVEAAEDAAAGRRLTVPLAALAE